MFYDGLSRLVSSDAANSRVTERGNCDTLCNLRSLADSSGTKSDNYSANNLLSTIRSKGAMVHQVMRDAKIYGSPPILTLTYVPCGGRESERSVPKPRHLTAVDLSQAVRCYEVGGDVDGIRYIDKRYRAFTDSSNNVIYVENAFSYTGT